MHTLKDRIHRLEGVQGGPGVASADLASSVPLGMPVGDSRASSPSGPHVPPPSLPDISAAPPSVISRPLPLDMSLLADGASTATLSTTGIQEFHDDGPWCAAPAAYIGHGPGGVGASFSLSDLAHAGVTPFGAAGSSASLRQSQSASRLPPAAITACPHSATHNPFAGTAAAAPVHPPTTHTHLPGAQAYPARLLEPGAQMHAATFSESPQRRQSSLGRVATAPALSPQGPAQATTSVPTKCATPERATASHVRDAASMVPATTGEVRVREAAPSQSQPLQDPGNTLAVWPAQLQAPHPPGNAPAVWPAQQKMQCANAAVQSAQLVTTPTSIKEVSNGSSS